MTRPRRLGVIRFDPTMYSRWCPMHFKDRKQTLANIKSLTYFSAASIFGNSRGLASQSIRGLVEERRVADNAAIVDKTCRGWGKALACSFSEGLNVFGNLMVPQAVPACSKVLHQPNHFITSHLSRCERSRKKSRVFNECWQKLVWYPKTGAYDWQRRDLWHAKILTTRVSASGSADLHFGQFFLEKMARHC